MMRKTAWLFGLSLLLTGSVFAQYTQSVFSEPNDGMIEDRDDIPAPQLHWDNDGGWTSGAGDWYNGLVCTVLPFQLPDVGAVADPYDSASFSAYLESNGLLNSVDLYFVRTSASSDLIATNDYYSGTEDPSATLLQAGFITPATIAGSTIDSDGPADASLVALLNAAYDNGAGAGDYVFLRLSYTFDSLPAGGGEANSAKINTRNNGDGSTWPRISIVSTVDLDFDTLPDIWEIANGLDPTDDGSTIVNNGPNGNPDTDDLINSDELIYGTDPQVDDTDDDGLLDGYEVAANPYVTDPIDSDSDDDLLSDGEEVNTWGTDPNDADSDNDDVNDATEVYANSDPMLNTSVPANERPEVVGIELFVDYAGGVFVDGAVGGELWDYDNSVSNDLYTGHAGAASTWFVTAGSPYINSGVLFTQNGSGLLRALNGAGTGGKDISLFAQAVVSPEVESEVLYAKVEITREAGVDWSGLSFFAAGQEEIFFGVADDGSGTNNVFKIDESGAGDTFSSVTASNNQTYTMVVAMDASTEYVALWVDPDLESPEPGADVFRPAVLPANLRCDSIRLASGGLGDVQWDNLVVGTTWESLSTSASDTDGDGMPDTWEITYGLDPYDDGTTNIINGASGNADTDLLSNIEEYENNTSPILDDTDDDGLDDDVEVDTTGTDPTKADTDGDDLKDGAELDADPYITNPLLADSDEDDYDDGVEIAAGTDPTDKFDNPGVNGDVLVDGILDRIVYGDPLAVQTVQTQFGDNYSELDAAYAYVKNGRLYLMLTGNIEANWNKLEILIDSTDSGTSNVLDAVNNDGGDKLDGLVFDDGFTPDYHLHFRRGDSGGAYFDIADLAAQTSSGYGSLFDFEGIETTGTGTVNAVAMEVAYDDSNTEGVLGGTAAADQSAATNVTTGFEFSIALSDLGYPSGSLKVCAFVGGSGRDGLSNQVLGGLPAGTDNLATDGLGNWPPATMGIDFNNFAGDQFFTVIVPVAAGPFDIANMQLISGNTQVQLTLNGLAMGQQYTIQDSVDLPAGFADVGSPFAATSTTAHVIVVPVDTGADPVRFFQAAEAP